MQRNVLKKRCLVLFVLITIAGVAGCSDSSAECKVTFDVAEDKFEIIVNPPGESEAFTQDGTLTRNMTISADAGEVISVTQYEVDIERTYEETGNIYRISGLVEFDESGDESVFLGYSLTVTGGVYGGTPHQCER